MSAALVIAGVSAGLEILGGLFGYLQSEQAAEQAQSRGRMLRDEADADAQRYAEQARVFKETQALSYLKSGVTLEGSPLDVLDETVRVTSENLSAIRARGAAQQFDMESQAENFRFRGRAGLIGGIAKGGIGLAKAGYADNSNAGAPSAGDTGFGYRAQVVGGIRSRAGAM